jgi:NitT/TauT family transport system permease protein
VALVAGLAVGCLLVISKRLEYLVLPYVNAAMALPVVAFVPLFILLFGFRSGPRIATIVTYVLFVVIVNTFAGARAVDPELLEMAHATGASPLRTFVSIRLPASLPLVMEGIAIGVSRGIIGMVTGEYLVSTAGVGGLLLTLAQNYRLPELYATVLVVLLLAVVVYTGFRSLESRVVAWSAGTT